MVLSALLVLGLFAAVYAFNGTNQTSASHCPMHKQTASAGDENDSCCGMADCCKDGKCQMGGDCCKDKDSCPMKQKAESKESGDMDMSKVTFVKGDEDCCQKGADCCKGGACCKHKS